MNIQDYVTKVLCVPVTRAGNSYITEAIELYLDTKSNRFYSELARLTGKSTNCLERAIRDARKIGLQFMTKEDKDAIFGEYSLTSIQYIILAAIAYRRDYENEKG